MKNLIITFLLLTTLVSKAQEKFLGNWTSNGLATDVTITINNNQLKVKSVSSLSGNLLSTTNVELKEKKLYLNNYYLENDWSSTAVFEIKDKNTLTALITNKNGKFYITYIKQKT